MRPTIPTRTVVRSVAALLSLPLAFAAADARAAVVTAEAIDNATVQPGGPRSSNNGKNFFNVEGETNGNFASFGVADFATAGLFAGPVNDVQSVVLSLTQSNAAFTAGGALRFFVAGDTARSIAPDAAGAPAPGEVFFDAAVDPDGVGTQFGTLSLLGAGTFIQGTSPGVNPGSAVGTGQVDTFTFDALTPEAENLLISQINAGQLRLVIAPGDGGVAGTFAGFSFAAPQGGVGLAGPTITIDATVVPEPGAAILLVAAAGLFLSRRSWVD